MKQKQGVVYLVGAGPGDPGLITRKGLEYLWICDVVVYDHLASELLLKELKTGCERIYVGKCAGQHDKKQDEINQILVDKAKEGKIVVRLKGGDPFVFGRGGEEILKLQEAGIPYETVSGVSSAIAALCSAGIPVTHRNISQSFHVMTGHTMGLDGGLPEDFEAFAKLSGTLVFLMGLHHMDQILERLISSGKSVLTPAAVIENGTLPEQRVMKGNLSNLSDLVKFHHIQTPSIIVVGETVELELGSTWKPALHGIRIGLVGTDFFTTRLSKQLEELGAQTEVVCSLEVEPYRGYAPLEEAFLHMGEYSWIVFTSANGIRLFFKRLWEAGYDYRAIGNLKIAVIGSGSAKELEHYGFRPDYMPPSFSSKDLAAGLSEILTPEDRVLIPRAVKGSEDLTRKLGVSGIPFDDIRLYDVKKRLPICSCDIEKEAGRLGECRYLVFASGSGVEAFVELWGAKKAKKGELLEGITTVCIGDITAGKLCSYGYTPDLTAKEYSIQGIVDVICEHVEKTVLR